MDISALLSSYLPVISNLATAGILIYFLRQKISALNTQLTALKSQIDSQKGIVDTAKAVLDMFKPEMFEHLTKAKVELAELQSRKEFEQKLEQQEKHHREQQSILEQNLSIAGQDLSKQVDVLKKAIQEKDEQIQNMKSLTITLINRSPVLEKWNTQDIETDMGSMLMYMASAHVLDVLKPKTKADYYRHRSTILESTANHFKNSKELLSNPEFGEKIDSWIETSVRFRTTN